MKGIFYASGPQFKRNFTSDNASSLYNIDLFGLMCIILDIEKCPPSNGSLANVQSFLKSKRSVVDRVIYSIGRMDRMSEMNVELFDLAWIGFWFKCSNRYHLVSDVISR